MTTRRQFLTNSAIALGGVSLLTATGISLLPSQENPPSFQATMQQLTELANTPLISTGQWQPATIFAHCAQSIALSIEGYPSHKPDWFKQSLGKTAFAIFNQRHAMTHNLAEPIPGAQQLTAMTTQAALQQLIDQLQRFENHTGPLAPHFAYGPLSKAAYRNAHLMHIQDHLQEIQRQAAE